jgi:hypothetical protein
MDPEKKRLRVFCQENRKEQLSVPYLALTERNQAACPLHAESSIPCGTE